MVDVGGAPLILSAAAFSPMTFPRKQHDHGGDAVAQDAMVPLKALDALLMAIIWLLWM